MIWEDRENENIRDDDLDTWEEFNADIEGQ